MLRSTARLIALVFFFFNDTATTEIYTLSLHDALPISLAVVGRRGAAADRPAQGCVAGGVVARREDDRLHEHHDRGKRDRKSTRLNSSHDQISYAVFCLKKKKRKQASRNTAGNHT